MTSTWMHIPLLSEVTFGESNFLMFVILVWIRDIYFFEMSAMFAKKISKFDFDAITFLDCNIGPNWLES